MIWVLVVLAALPLLMGGIMLLILRSGALHRMRKDGDGSTPHAGGDRAAGQCGGDGGGCD